MVYMTQEKIICFSQKTSSCFSVEGMMKIQQMLKDVPDEAFPLLMNYKLKRGYFATKMMKFFYYISTVVLGAVVGFMIILSLVPIPFIENEAPVLRIIFPIVAVFLLPLIWICTRNLKRLKPYKQQAFVEYRDLIMKYLNH